jgi:hypothetical protein
MMHPRKPKYAPQWLHKIDRKVLVSLVIAVGMIAALSTFASAPKKGNQKPNQTPQGQQSKQNPAGNKKQGKDGGRQVKWEANGADAESCKTGPKNTNCEISPSDKAMRSAVNHEIRWKTANMEEGAYRLSFYYRNYATLPPENPYRYHITIYVNGKKVGEERLLASQEVQRFSSKDITLKNGANTIQLKWDNDQQAAGNRDANLAWRSINVTRLANQPGGEEAKTDQYLAEQILDQVQKGRVTFPYQSSTGDSKEVLKQLADGKEAPVTCSNAGTNHTKVNPNILKFVIAASEKTKVGINAITDKCHTSGSNHYKGKAIDLQLGVGDTGQILNIAKQYGGVRNSETSHIHLDFL